MRRLLHIVVVLAGLVAIAAGGGCTPRYDGRLMAADSLMRDNPDSALAIVSDVDRAALATEGDRAYRDLLLTQARYRCYITATSDSDINRALHYYRHHQGEREKLTRALIYKGAVMEELGHPDSAMHYYMDAEEVADSTDYFNLGYAKMRMGALYRDHYSLDGKDIEKYEEALEYLKRTNINHTTLACMINLGSLYRLKKVKKSEEILLDAKHLAKQNGDTAFYVSILKSLVQTYYVQHKYLAARKLVNKVMRLDSTNNDIEFAANAACIYAKFGLTDSAELMLNACTNRNFKSVIEQLMYLEGLGEIALAKGDSTTYHLMDNVCRHKEDSLNTLDHSMRILQTEEKHKKSIIEQNNKRNQQIWTWLYLVIIISIASICTFAIYSYRREHRFDKLIADLRTESDSHLDQIKQLQEKINTLGINDKKLIDYFDSHLWLMHDVIDECYHMPNDKIIRKIKHIIEFKEQNKEKWSRLNVYIDLRFNNILSITKERYPQLNDRDIMLIALSTLDFSCSQIAIIMGYKNASSVGTIRTRLAQKMKLDTSIMQYIKKYTN